MPSEIIYESPEARALARRVDLAISALTNTLNDFTPRDRNAPAARLKRRPSAAASARPQARPVLGALAAALLRDVTPDGLGALTWYELKQECRMTDGALGLVLSGLIPRHVCTRDTGDERIYFLPRAERRKLRARGGALKIVKAA